MIILGLDLSTSVIGYSIIDKNIDQVEFINYGFIDVNFLIKNSDNNDNDFYLLFEKAELSYEKIKDKILEYHPQEIRIETPVKKFKPGFSNIDSISKLICFNYYISNKIYLDFKLKPIHIESRTARVNVFGKGINGLSIDNKKEVLLDMLIMQYPQLQSIKSNKNKRGNLDKKQLDVSDSIIISLS